MSWPPFILSIQDILFLFEGIFFSSLPEILNSSTTLQSINPENCLFFWAPSTRLSSSFACLCIHHICPSIPLPFLNLFIFKFVLPESHPSICLSSCLQAVNLQGWLTSTPSSLSPKQASEFVCITCAMRLSIHAFIMCSPLGPLRL